MGSHIVAITNVANGIRSMFVKRDESTLGRVRVMNGQTVLERARQVLQMTHESPVTVDTIGDELTQWIYDAFGDTTSLGDPRDIQDVVKKVNTLWLPCARILVTHVRPLDTVWVLSEDDGNAVKWIDYLASTDHTVNHREAGSSKTDLPLNLPDKFFRIGAKKRRGRPFRELQREGLMDELTAALETMEHEYQTTYRFWVTGENEYIRLVRGKRHLVGGSRFFVPLSQQLEGEYEARRARQMLTAKATFTEHEVTVVGFGGETVQITEICGDEYTVRFEASTM